MNRLADRWFFVRRHQELLEEAGWVRLVRRLRRAPKGRPGGVSNGRLAKYQWQTYASTRGSSEDAPRIAGLMELNGMPRWVAFEERFILAEDKGKLMAVVRFPRGLRVPLPGSARRRAVG